MPTPQYEDVYEPPMLDSTGQAIANAIQGLNPTVPSFISDAFSVERSYSTGDIVIYENKVYVFTSNKSAGAWDSTKVTETTIGAICTATNASLTNLDTKTSEIAKVITASGTYSIGANSSVTVSISANIPSGYTAVMGYISATGNADVFMRFLDLSAMEVGLINKGTSAQNNKTIGVKVLCIKTSLL